MALLKSCKNIDKQFRDEVKREQKAKINRILTNHQGSPANLWKAAKIAVNCDQDEPIPSRMLLEDDVATSDREKAELFARHFEDKMNTTTEPPKPQVNNGEKILDIPDTRIEIGEDLVMHVLTNLKNKTCYGFDRLPMRLLKDAKEHLKRPMTILFNKIADEGVPEIWKTSRIIPIYKKGDKTKIENYRPISNLCSLAKVYERCLLHFITELDKKSGYNLTGKTQMGFKKGHSTTSLALTLQSKIARAIDNGKMAGLLSLDLTAAFDLVDHETLFNRMTSLGIPNQLVGLIKDWLSNRNAYVETNQTCSNFFRINKGTVQGSVLGPVLFAIYIRPVFNLAEIDAYADDSYLFKEADSLKELHDEIERKAEQIARWMRENGLLVNIAKTEFVVFAKRSHSVTIKVMEQNITSTTTMRVLGVVFDEKLSWSQHVDATIKKVKSAAYSLKRIAKFVPQDKMMELATAFAYSRLYYAAAVWLIPNLAKPLWSRLLSTSAHVIKAALSLQEWTISFNDLHEVAGRGTPKMMANYVTSTNLHSIMQDEIPDDLSARLKRLLKVNVRTDKFYVQKNGKTRISKNDFCERLDVIQSEIKASDLNAPKDSFRRKMKLKFLKFW